VISKIRYLYCIVFFFKRIEKDGDKGGRLEGQERLEMPEKKYF